MGARKKTLAQYESEASKVGAYLVHPTRTGLARRVYQMRHGTIESPGLLVCHTCDNPACILDRHHFLGTHADNMADMTRKGRKKLAMNRPEVLANISAASRAASLRPEVRQNRSVAMQRRFSRPEERRKVGKGCAEHYARPGVLEAARARMNAPAYRALQSSVQKVAQNRPEVKSKKSEAQRRSMLRPEMRVHNSAAQKIAQNRKEVRGAKVAWAMQRWLAESEHVKMRVAQNKPGVNERRSESLRKTLATDHARALKREAAKRGWITRKANQHRIRRCGDAE